MVWLGTGRGAEVDLERFGQKGCSNDAAADEVAVDVPYLALKSVCERWIYSRDKMRAYGIFKLQEGVRGKVHTSAVPVRRLFYDVRALVGAPGGRLDSDFLEPDVVPVHV